MNTTPAHTYRPGSPTAIVADYVHLVIAQDLLTRHRIDATDEVDRVNLSLSIDVLDRLATRAAARAADVLDLSESYLTCEVDRAIAALNAAGFPLDR